MDLSVSILSLLQRDAAHPGKGCTIDTCPVSYSVYGYLPNKPLNMAFLAIFAVLFLGHIFMGIKRRAWSFMVVLGIGTLLEVIGYLGRVQMHKDPFKIGPLSMNIVCLTVAPAFMAAGIYLTLKHLVIIIGPQYSRFVPRYYTKIFIWCDIISIIIQTGGSTLSNREKLVKVANIIMEVGIATQVVTLLIFGALAFEFRLRCSRATASTPLEPRIKRAIIAVIIAYSAIMIRCIYRIAEMAGGWRNKIMQDQISFVVLDGVMCVVAVLVLLVWHPGVIFQRSRAVLKGVHTEESAGSAVGSAGEVHMPLEKRAAGDRVVHV